MIDFCNLEKYRENNRIEAMVTDRLRRTATLRGCSIF